MDRGISIATDNEGGFVCELHSAYNYWGKEFLHIF